MNLAENCSCRGFSIVLGVPKLALGLAGMKTHDAAMAGGKHDPPAAVVIGEAAKLPTPGMTKPLVDAGQAEDAAPC